MNLSLNVIDEFEFNKQICPILFNEKEIDRKFGIIFNEKLRYRFGWQSDLIMPSLAQIDKSIYSLGIDLNFALINSNTGDVKLNIHLNQFYFDVKTFNEFVYVISEVEVIKIHLTTFSILDRYQLPDYYESIEVKKDEIEIKCTSGKTISF